MIRLLLTILFPCVILASSWAVDTSARTYRIGLLESMSASDPEVVRLREALWDGLRELGYMPGKNLILDVVYSEGRSERFPDLAKELIARKVDLIVVTTTPAGLAAKAATTTIPILFPMAIDPVGTGLVASLARPGGNATGISMVSVELSGKRLELLKELTPRLSQLGVLLNPTNAGNARTLCTHRGGGTSTGHCRQAAPGQQPRGFSARICSHRTPASRRSARSSRSADLRSAPGDRPLCAGCSATGRQCIEGVGTGRLPDVLRGGLPRRLAPRGSVCGQAVEGREPG